MSDCIGTPRVVSPYTHRRYPGGYFRPDVVRDLLSLVSVDIPLLIVSGWTATQQETAGNWALRVHLRASDNNTVRVPEKPDFIPDYRPLNPGARSVMEL